MTHPIEVGSQVPTIGGKAIESSCKENQERKNEWKYYKAPSQTLAGSDVIDWYSDAMPGEWCTTFDYVQFQLDAGFGHLIEYMFKGNVELV